MALWRCVASIIDPLPARTLNPLLASPPFSIMMMPVHLRCLFGLGTLLVLPAAANAAAAIGEAEVREGADGVPCFTIAEREERRSGAPNFEAISVTEVAGKRRAVVWSMAMPQGRTFPLMFNMCIPYGGRVPALPQRSAELLEAGTLYEVAIAVRQPQPAPPQSQPNSLVARFCLLRRADGSKAVSTAAACNAPPAPARGSAQARHPG